MEMAEMKIRFQSSKFLDVWCFYSENRPAVLAAFVLIAILSLSFKTWMRNGNEEADTMGKTRVPPTYPFIIPILGHTISMGWDTPNFLSTIINNKRFKNIPVRLQLLVADVYLISGDENVNAVWKNDRHMHNKAYKTLAVQNMFKMPKATLSLFNADDSGIGVLPHPGSAVPAHLRIEYLTHSSVSKMLTGPGLKPFADRFTQNLIDQLLKKSSINLEWTCIPDLFSLMQAELLSAELRSMCGEYLLLLNPTFVEDFWAFNRVLHTLAKGYPKLFFPKPYKARDKCLESLKIWHRFIRGHFHEPGSNTVPWNPYFGTEFIKFRHQMWSKMDQFNSDSAATEDLGLIWAANGNSIPASFWMLAEVIRDSALLSRVRVIIETCRLDSPSGTLDFDLPGLGNDPLLQSIYAETLRLRVASFLIRGPERGKFELKHWDIPQNAVMMVSGFNAQLDKDAWETNGGRPVQEFWPERFLEYSDQTKAERDAMDVPPKKTSRTGSFRFSLEGRSASWIPYGGGQRMCPGRHFNKQAMITTLAIMLTLFDIELLDPNSEIPQSDMSGYGFGALWPKGNTPVRMRRRFP